MKWTKEPPYKQGWYWNKIGRFEVTDSDLVYVVWSDRKKRFVGLDVDSLEYVDLNYFGDCEWFGPIEPPEEEHD